jgi:hypothetical protein
MKAGDIIEYYIPKNDAWYVGFFKWYILDQFDNLYPNWRQGLSAKNIEWRESLYKRQCVIETRNGKEISLNIKKIRLKYSFRDELTELLETGTIKQKEEKEKQKMKKFTTIGMIAKKKDGSGSYIKMDADVSLKKGQFVTISKKPTEEQVEANPKLKMRAEKWPSWKVADLVLVTDE